MFTANGTQAIHIAKQLARENHHSAYAPAHFLKAMLNREFSFIRELDAAGIDVFYIDEWADIRMEEYPKTSRPDEDPAPDEAMEAVFAEAEDIAKNAGREEVGFIPMLMALVTPGVGFSHDELKSMPVTALEIAGKLGYAGNAKNRPQSGSGLPNAASYSGEAGMPAVQGALDKYCTDKVAAYREKEDIPLVGRDEELKAITEILNRKLKPHVIVTGEAGVGKTALIDGFCGKIAENHIIAPLQGASVMEVNTGVLFAGASYKGEVEDRLQKIFLELKRMPKPMLFIDDIHELFDANQGNGIASIVKSELAKGDITFIGATSTEKYRKSLGKDDALNRRFETLEVTEPTEDLALRMLKNVAPHYEEHHQFKIDENGLKEAIRLSGRYLKEKSLPDSALDLIDRTMSSLRVAKEMVLEELPALKEKLEGLKDSGKENREEELHWLYTDILDKSGELLGGEEEETSGFYNLKMDEEKADYLEKLLLELEALTGADNVVTPDHLSAVVSGITGIPAGKVKSEERERLLEIEDSLKQRVVGQDHAIKVVSDAILESRSGLTKPGQPIGSFFFLGPTGTGKTELAKSLADFLFGDENAIIRLDMSEFKEEHSAALLYGAPPGYVGYEEGGLLVNKIRQNPYSIVLFDEIEKAHRSVFDVFLQILDEGKLHDRLGKEGDFSNAVVLFTSNIGSDFVVKSFTEGKIPVSNDLLEIMSAYFRPEFLGRLTEIVPFAPISRESVVKIFDIHLKKELTSLLSKLDITLKITDKTKEKVALMGFSPEYGARPIKGIIRNKLKRPLARKLISGDVGDGDTLTLSLTKKGETKFSVKKQKDEKKS